VMTKESGTVLIWEGNCIICYGCASCKTNSMVEIPSRQDSSRSPGPKFSAFYGPLDSLIFSQ
jgi:hypothetical protein